MHPMLLHKGADRQEAVDGGPAVLDHQDLQQGMSLMEAWEAQAQEAAADRHQEVSPMGVQEAAADLQEALQELGERFSILDQASHLACPCGRTTGRIKLGIVPSGKFEPRPTRTLRTTPLTVS